MHYHDNQRNHGKLITLVDSPSFLGYCIRPQCVLVLCLSNSCASSSVYSLYRINLVTMIRSFGSPGANFQCSFRPGIITCSLLIFNSLFYFNRFTTLEEEKGQSSNIHHLPGILTFNMKHLTVKYVVDIIFTSKYIIMIRFHPMSWVDHSSLPRWKVLNRDVVFLPQICSEVLYSRKRFVKIQGYIEYDVSYMSSSHRLPPPNLF